jgi:hypothetical protein
VLSVRGAHLWAFLLILAVTGCGKPLTDEECTQLLDRYTEKVIDQARPKAGQAERSELVLEARQKAALDPEFAECSRRVSRKEFDCAMAAGNADQIERCLM